MAMMGSATASGDQRAVEATRRAISSPLLEDIDLHGARGLLVNITASPDMRIGEYEAVGKAISEYAAEDANVVIGTAFDDSMHDELRVTMVATGLLGAPRAVRNERPERPERTTRAPVAPVDETPRARPQVAATPSRGSRPMAWRHKRRDIDAPKISEADDTAGDLPGFLRRQAD